MKTIKNTSPKQIPKTIWQIGLAGMFMNMSSVISLTFLPLFLTTNLGVTAAITGALEGIVEAISLFTRLFAGIISDKMNNRKKVFLLGYIVTFLSRGFVLMSGSAIFIVLLRVIDKIGNGMQASPRDALINQLSPVNTKALCYSLRYGVSIIGAVIGGLIGYYCAYYVSYWEILSLGLIPAFVSIILLYTVNTKKNTDNNTYPSRNYSLLSILLNLKTFNKSYWQIVIVSFFYNFGVINLAFLLFLAKNLNIQEEYFSLIVTVKTLFCTIVSIVLGIITNKNFSHYHILLFGFIVAIIGNSIFYISNTTAIFYLSILFFGTQLSIGQTILIILVANECKKDLQATGFGFFHLINGLSTILSNIVMGLLWNSDYYSFMVNVVFLVIGMLFYIYVLTQNKTHYLFELKNSKVL